MQIRIHCICGQEIAPKEELFQHLRGVLRDFDVCLTDSDSILPGEEVDLSRRLAVVEAHIVILLHSADVDLLPEVEIAVDRCKKGLLRLAPVRLNASAGGMIGGLQMLPRDGRAVAHLEHRDEAWMVISTEVKTLCEQVAFGQPLRSAVREELRRAAEDQSVLVAATEGLLQQGDHTEREALLHVLLVANLPEVYHFWTRKLFEIELCNSGELPSLVSQVLLRTSRLRKGLAQEGCHPAAGIAEALATFGELAEQAGKIEDPAEAMFGDFIVGLAIFDAVTALAVLIVAPSLDVGNLAEISKWRSIYLGRFEDLTFPTVLGAAIGAHMAFLEAAEPLYRQDSSRLWAQIVHTLIGLDNDLKKALQRCVSLRAIPRNRGTMALEQVLHWHGWGGQGEFFELLGPYISRNSLLSQIYEYRDYSFNWYGRGATERSGTPPPFAWRFSAFQKAAVALTEFAVKITVALLSHPALMVRSSQSTYSCRMWTDAVGPLRATERAILRRLERLSLQGTASDFRVKAVYTEASSECLLSLSNERYAFCGDRYILRRDLNLPFPGEPGVRVASGCDPWSPNANSFDIYVCAFALHQIVDDILGHDRLLAVLAFATRIVRPGGVLCIPDVDAGAWLQACLLPINLVDREGHWSIDRAFGPSGWLSFLDVSCKSDGAFLSKAELRRLGPDELVKIPLPLLDFRSASPEFADDCGNYLYEFTPCVIIVLRLETVRILEDRWARTTLRSERAALGLEYLREWNSGTSRLFLDLKHLCTA